MFEIDNKILTVKLNENFYGNYLSCLFAMTLDFLQVNEIKNRYFFQSYKLSNLANTIFFRPRCGDGLWVLYLLPISIVISVIRHPIIASDTYKLISLCCIGFVISSIEIWYKKFISQKLNILSFGNFFGTFLTAFAAHIYLQKGMI